MPMLQPKERGGVMVWGSILMVFAACGGGTGGSGSSTGSPAGGCAFGAAYCYDFVGASWNATIAETHCNLVSDELVAGGSPAATYDAAGCPGNATAECAGFDGFPGDPDSEIIIYYYEDPPMSLAEDACIDGGGNYTLY